MIYEIECEKRNVVNTIVDIFLKDKTFNLINTVPTDRNAANNTAHGYVFESTEKINGKKFVFALKDINTSNGENGNQIVFMVTNDYTLPVNPNTNGSYGSIYSNWLYLYITNSSYLLSNTKLKVYLDIKPHRIILSIYNTFFTGATPSLLYLGYPKLETNIEVNNMYNIIIAGINVTSPNNDNNNPHVMRNILGTKFTTEAFYTSLTPMNPNALGEYTISNISIGDGNVGIFGQLDDIWVMPNLNINQLDIFELQGEKYRVLRFSIYNGYCNFINNLGAIANIVFILKYPEITSIEEDS